MSLSEARVRTILCVDDDPWLLAAARRTLEAERHRVLTTTEPLQVLPLVEWERVDVVVADLEMPQVDGVHLLQRLRQLYPDVVRILLTGTATVDAAVKSINEGEVFRFLTKPLKPVELVQAVAAAILRRDALRQVAAREAAAAQRDAGLRELERRHPGLSAAPAEAGVHVIEPARGEDLIARFRGSAIAGLLAPGDTAEKVAPGS